MKTNQPIYQPSRMVRGTLQVLLYRLGRTLNFKYRTDIVLHLNEPQDCRECGLCAKVCPMQLPPYVDTDDDGRLDDNDCMRCGICAENRPLYLLKLERFDERTARAADVQQRKAG